MSTQDTPKASNIHWHHGRVTRQEREQRAGHKGVTIWLTGLSGSGKSTVGNRLAEFIYERGGNAYVLDGDNIRFGLNKDLGFSPADRKENIRRIGEVSKLFTDNGTIAITAFISPYREDRDLARSIMNAGDFVEVYVKADISVCESRDPKGLYKKARAGEISNFTGISAPYEEPLNPELVVDTGAADLDTCTQQIMLFLEEKGYFFSKSAQS